MTDAPPLSEAAHAAARDYLRLNRKAPYPHWPMSCCWVLLAHEDRTMAVYPDELPAAIFHRLRSDQERPWLFRSIPDAMRAAHQATAEAIEAGEIRP